MAMKKCRECGAEVSGHAKTCLHCGIDAPGSKLQAAVNQLSDLGASVWKIGAGILFLLIFGTCAIGLFLPGDASTRKQFTPSRQSSPSRQQRQSPTRTVPPVTTTAPTPQPTPVARQAPQHVIDQIKRRLAKTYPDNYSIQRLLLEQDVEAYQKLAQFDDPRMPIEDRNAVMQRHAKDYQSSYSMQLILLEQEVEAYDKIINYDFRGAPRDVSLRIYGKIRHNYPHCYTLQLLLLDDEIESYLRLYPARH